MPKLVLLSAQEERKMASSTVLTTAAKAGKTPQKQKARPLDTFPAIFMTEIKRTIATESVSQFSSTDMSIAGSYYHGTGAIVSQISKFLQGADKYGNIWVKEDTPDGPMTVMPEYLHRQVDKVLITGRNITPQSLENTSATKAGRVSGRTIRTWAIACICEAKKMLTLVDEAVKEKILQREEDEYEYCSGKNESDFIHFLLYRMYHWKVFNGATADEDTHVNAKAEVEDLLVQIKSIETELHNLKSDSAANSVEVDEYLKRGRMAMGIKSASNKKQKLKGKETSTLSVDCDLDI